MTVERFYRKLLRHKNLAPDFKPMRSQTEPMGFCMCDFSRALSKLMVIARNSDRFTVLFAPVVIGRGN